MDGARVHASIHEERLLQSNQRELLLKGFGDALYFARARSGSGTVCGVSRILLERHQGLLLVQVSVLLDISLRVELLLLVLGHLRTVELV